MFRLDSKVAVVTGGGSGIGKATAKVLASQGAYVHIIDLLIENGEQVCKEIIEQNGKATAHKCDLSDFDNVKAVFSSIGKLDVLVNNAGIAHIGNAINTQPQDFDKVYNINIKGVYHCLHFAIPSLIDNGGGVIINVSSIAAYLGLTDRFAYSMSKGAVHAMTISVARDFIKQNIRCNSISPARVHTPFVDGFIAKNYPGKEEEMFAKLAASQPIGRMGTVEEIAALILYLCSEEASFITGSDYAIDGGFTHLNT